MIKDSLHLAKWWTEDNNGKLLCTLCPRYCSIGESQAGFCYIRQNINGKLYSTGYGHPTGFAIDPIEKKPLNHFYPGTQILSFGTAGCNLGCKFCQNWSMSKAKLDNIHSLDVTPTQVVELAINNKVPSIAYTYNDPVIFGEYVIDISKIARVVNIKNVMVTAGYIDKNARSEVFEYIDAANVDLKGFTESFYYKLTASHINPVLDTLIWIKKETDIWLEITTLLIPDENDNDDELKLMCDWIVENLGDEVPLHFTAFHPDFKMLSKPRTPHKTLFSAREIALKGGIKYCYLGNIHTEAGSSTYCHYCNHLLIERDWHSIIQNNIKSNQCPKCGAIIPGIFM